ncbi:Orotidine 5'-phosphate decarboxylase [Fervidicola ferrireducens]|uniref:Orotidine 5'-phosphate decarboxylase n=1 Tax=Fervidicola ferrireducens TaxID=520764 RepID=A0A140L4E0_9FIRM|nr:orotidine-5'-phosphate decarboxylase [Fervidicola ferrireducens]KXG75415.1 Orotidine 5'-phosphate decarboxylase [Fervidicola ferrireducens]
MEEYFKKVIIALDTNEEKKAIEIVRLLKNRVGIFKVGLELFTGAGPSIVRRINEEGCRVFLDLKFHDIPNTVYGAVKQAARLGAFLLNVHASGGRKMMEWAKKAVEEVFESDSEKRPKILAVTVLTSLDVEDLREMNVEKSPRQQVLSLAKMAKEAGLDGVVASPEEVREIKEVLGRDFLVVAPGVRPAFAAALDQKRVMKPLDAIQAGADYIVIGRPVTAAEDPLVALEKIFD